MSKDLFQQNGIIDLVLYLIWYVAVEMDQIQIMYQFSMVGRLLQNSRNVYSFIFEKKCIKGIILRLAAIFM